MANQARGKTVEMTSELRGYYAQSNKPGPCPGLIVFMEIFGLTKHIKLACERLADAGFSALAPDIYHGKVFAYDDIASAKDVASALSQDQILAETTAAFNWLGAQSSIDNARLGVIGFCLGGWLAFLTHGSHPQRSAAGVCFYGGGIAPETDHSGRPPLLDKIPAMAGPVMLGYGAEDQSVPPSEHGRIATALSAAKKRYALDVFPEAGHGFMCEDRSSYAPRAAEQAWERAIEFLHTTLRQPAAD